ncbi:MAG: iron-containing alcohol dehydrogenase [Chloroflexota bacterium]
MDNFTYYNPVKLIFGKGKIASIGKEISRNEVNRVLMLYGGGSIKKNGVYEQTVNSLREAGIEFIEFGGVQPNPTLEHARAAIEMIRENNLEGILAVGGGSCIDEAKSIAAGYYLDDPWSAFEGREKIVKALPVFTILTISATGSEMNSFAVLTNEEERKKWSIGSPNLFPRVSIVDPEIQSSLPRRQTANGGADALSHVMEYYFLLDRQEITLQVDEAIMRSIISSIDKLMEDELNYEARANFAWASTIALNGLSCAGLPNGDWASHAIEHGISAMHPEIAHGEGLSIVFPAWIKYVSRKRPERFLRWAKNVWNCDSIDLAVLTMKEKFHDWGAPISLREKGITAGEIAAIAENTLLQGLPGVFQELKREDVTNILKLAL